jgi:hypothetical protein
MVRVASGQVEACPSTEGHQDAVKESVLGNAALGVAVDHAHLRVPRLAQQPGRAVGDFRVNVDCGDLAGRWLTSSESSAALQPPTPISRTFMSGSIPRSGGAD